MASKQTQTQISALRDQGYVVLSSAAAKKLAADIQKVDGEVSQVRDSLSYGGDEKSLNKAIRGLDKVLGKTNKLVTSLV